MTSAPADSFGGEHSKTFVSTLAGSSGAAPAPLFAETGALLSGFDLSREAEQRERPLWAQLFDQPATTYGFTDVDPFLLPEGAVLVPFETLEKPRHVAEGEAPRPEALHLYGVDRLSTRDLKRYFVENECIEPSWIEWINDSSCNAVFADEHTANWVLARLSIGPPMEPDVLRAEEERWLGIQQSSMAEHQRREETAQHDPELKKDAAEVEAPVSRMNDDAEQPSMLAATEPQQPLQDAAASASNEHSPKQGALTAPPASATNLKPETGSVFMPAADPLLWWRPARPFPSSHNTWLPLRIRRATVVDVRPERPNPQSAWSRSVRQPRKQQRRRSYPEESRKRVPRERRFSAAGAAGRIQGRIQKGHRRHPGKARRPRRSSISRADALESSAKQRESKPSQHAREDASL
jgi:hypothetical protein